MCVHCNKNTSTSASLLLPQSIRVIAAAAGRGKSSAAAASASICWQQQSSIFGLRLNSEKCHCERSCSRSAFRLRNRKCLLLLPDSSAAIRDLGIFRCICNSAVVLIGTTLRSTFFVILHLFFTDSEPKLVYL